MDSDQKFWLTFWAMAFASLTIVIVAIIIACSAGRRKMLEEGYSESLQPCAFQVVWRKEGAR